MPRALRLDMAGFHHIVNRGVEKRKVFLDEDDFEFFLNLLCSLCEKNNANLHSYCLMSNHYHLLLETKQDNLSKIMRALNAQYASYFNRKIKRVGHLWQGRYKSWYVTDEAYLYGLIKYIEINPIKAKMTKLLGEYKHASYNAFIGNDSVPECLKNSILFKDYATPDERIEFFSYGYDEDEIKMIAKSSSLVCASIKNKELSVKELDKLFKQVNNKNERNIKIKEAIKIGYSQHKIAKYLGLSQPAISSVLKK